MSHQRTLKTSFTLKGQGLHTGLDITLTFKPAPADHGIKIQRVDLADQPIIDALAENVKGSNRGTVLCKGDVEISTIEHAMAALFCAQIDNALLEVNAPEFPILDGSAIQYAEKIEETGWEEQEKEREYFFVKKRIEIRDEASNSSIVLLPDDKFSIDTHISYDSCILSNQYATLDDISNFKSEIAGCRTFVFVREIEWLLSQNLIKGGHLDNAIVVYDQEIAQSEIDRLAKLMNQDSAVKPCLGYINGKLNYDNEPARHKLMDVIGDLALIGRPIVGKIIATRPGHTINTAFAKQIRKDIKKQDLQAPVYNPDVEALLDTNGIKKILPHRWPFLLVDKIIEMSNEKVVGVKNVTVNETFFQGHFPDEPVMPGVLIVEAMAQTGGILALHNVEEPEKWSTYFVKIDGVRFRSKVIPGDTLVFRLDLIEPIRRGMVHMRATAFVGERIVTEADVMAQIVKNK